jgi:hypothetical protein
MRRHNFGGRAVKVMRQLAAEHVTIIKNAASHRGGR